MKNKTTLIAAALLFLAGHGYAQPGRGGGPPRSPKESAPFDLTGYWVSIVTEDWRFRMFTPPKGDLAGIPLNAEGRRLANAWDPAADQAAGNQCKSYGAAAIMRVPGRLHIAWQDDNTLKIEADAGTQTRLLHFNGTPPPGGAPTLQGYSVAQWERQLGRSRGGEGQPGLGDSRGGSLKVTTTQMQAGYLRKNGPPYSANAKMTEYYDIVHEPNGDQWIVVKTIVEDPVYLTRPFFTSPNFKKQPNATGWNPGPCEVK